jgi:hypothetical protein
MYCVGIFSVPVTGVLGIHKTTDTKPWFMAHEKKCWIDDSITDRWQHPTIKVYASNSVCVNQLLDCWPSARKKSMSLETFQNGIFPMYYHLVLADVIFLGLISIIPWMSSSLCSVRACFGHRSSLLWTGLVSHHLVLKFRIQLSTWCTASE